MNRPRRRDDGWPTRADIRFDTDAERLCRITLGLVESMGASVALTNAVACLDRARNYIADHVEGGVETDDNIIAVPVTDEQRDEPSLDVSAQRLADIALAGYERGEVSLSVLAEMYELPADEMQQQAAAAGYWVEWLTPLLTEASACAHGHGNADSMRAVILGVPETFRRHAGLLWSVTRPDPQPQTGPQLQDGNR